MPQAVSELPIQLLVPDNWEVQQTDNDDGFVLQLQSPGVMFMLVSLVQHCSSHHILQQALHCIENEYQDVESSPAEDLIAGRRTDAIDVNFWSLDLSNTCWLRSIETGTSAILILGQTCDLNLEQDSLIFQAICKSIELCED